MTPNSQTEYAATVLLKFMTFLFTAGLAILGGVLLYYHHGDWGLACIIYAAWVDLSAKLHYRRA
jgi:hypothetical protein